MPVPRGSACSVVLCSLALLLLVNVDLTSAKRGCTSFGHSCFGGHGKRSNIGLDMSSQKGYPRELDSEMDATPMDDVRVEPAPMPMGVMMPPRAGRPALAMSPLLRQWLQTYRRSDGVDIESK